MEEGLWLRGVISSEENLALSLLNPLFRISDELFYFILLLVVNTSLTHFKHELLLASTGGLTQHIRILR